MFKENNIILFLLCILPILFYSLIISIYSPQQSIKPKTSFNYLYSGLLSITILQFISFVFPHLHDNFFQETVKNFKIKDETFSIIRPTLNTLLLFTFVQIALMEELSKWLALKCVDIVRGKRKKNLDHPYAIIFYSCLVSAGFAIVENIQYASSALQGALGHETPEKVLIIRAMSSVIVHMTCGIFMGYYIALSKGSKPAKKILYNSIGIFIATFMHGIYDFNWLKPGSEKDYYDFFNSLPIHMSSLAIICFCLSITFMMAWHLKHINHEIKPQ